jgi:predicted RNA-binding Zn-ribbon protein involved in translation (DUF1610 family)
MTYLKAELVEKRMTNGISIKQIGDLEAHCFSFRCFGGLSTAKGVVKSVEPKTLCCPDCGSVLVWKSKSRKINRTTKLRRFDYSAKEIGVV